MWKRRETKAGSARIRPSPRSAKLDSRKWPSHRDDFQDEEERRTPLHFLDGLAEKAGDANCFAGA